MVTLDDDRAPIFQSFVKQNLLHRDVEMEQAKSVQISLTSPDHIYLGKKKEVVRLLCLDLTKSTRFVQFFVCSAGVFLFYLIYGYMQELIFRLPGFQPFGWYLTLVQFALYTGFGVGEQKIRRESGRK